MLGTYYERVAMYVANITIVIVAFLLPTKLFSSPQHFVSGQCRRVVSITDEQDDVYTNLGDVNIGGYISPDAPIQVSESIAYAVKTVNEDPHLLPNTTLGFVLVNYASLNSAVAKAFHFLPDVTNDFEPGGACFCSPTFVSRINSSSRTDRPSGYYDIIGAIAAPSSTITVPLSYLFSAAKIPLISCKSTSDELSDKSQHPYFLRITAANKVQVQAMLAFIHANGWSYVSVLYAAGSYGESGYQSIKHLAPQYNVCLATAHSIDERSDFHYVVTDLLKYRSARVVILFIYYIQIIPFFQDIKRNNASDTFIWICGDAIGSSFISTYKGHEKDFLGAFVLSYQESFVPNLYQHIGKLRINSTTNPWLKLEWETLFGCSFTQGTCDNDSSILDASNFVFSNLTSLYVDSVMVFAHAVTTLLADLCNGLNGAEARACITGDNLLEYMKRVSFEGYSGHVAFEGNGVGIGQYSIRQMEIGYRNTLTSNSSSIYELALNIIALYNIATNQIIYTGHKISWDHLIKFKSEVPRLINSAQQSAVPESVCSKPCLPGEYVIHTKQGCCWECRECRGNERLVNKNTNCKECEPFTWPDPETAFTTCKDITVTFPSLTDPVAVILIFLVSLTVVCAVVVSLGFVHFRGSPVIKASSREPSVLQLVAVGVGCLTVILLQLPPTDGICGTLYFTLCLSFTCLYSPLLVKSLRDYRIFLGSSRCHRNPRFTSCFSQVILTITLICIQTIMCLAMYVIYQPAARKSQPVPMDKYVELSCDMTLPGLISFLVYNLALVFICSVFAFKTRQLPDNFNESKFIFIWATTNLIIWLVFVPTYFTASGASVKTMMLSLAILLNHTLTLAFLFMSKIYAAAHTSTNV